MSYRSPHCNPLSMHYDEGCGCSLKALAKQQQAQVFVQEKKMLGCCSFLWHYVRIKCGCTSLKHGFEQLRLISTRDKRVARLTDHIFGWDVDKKREIVQLVKETYAPLWKEYTRRNIDAKVLTIGSLLAHCWLTVGILLSFKIMASTY